MANSNGKITARAEVSLTDMMTVTGYSVPRIVGLIHHAPINRWAFCKPNVLLSTKMAPTYDANNIPEWSIGDGENCTCGLKLYDAIKITLADLISQYGTVGSDTTKWDFTADTNKISALWEYNRPDTEVCRRGDFRGYNSIAVAPTNGGFSIVETGQAFHTENGNLYVYVQMLPTNSSTGTYVGRYFTLLFHDNDTFAIYNQSKADIDTIRLKDLIFPGTTTNLGDCRFGVAVFGKNTDGRFQAYATVCDKTIDTFLDGEPTGRTFLLNIGGLVPIYDSECIIVPFISNMVQVQNLTEVTPTTNIGNLLPIPYYTPIKIILSTGNPYYNVYLTTIYFNTITESNGVTVAGGKMRFRVTIENKTTSAITLDTLIWQLFAEDEITTASNEIEADNEFSIPASSSLLIPYTMTTDAVLAGITYAGLRLKLETNCTGSGIPTGSAPSWENQIHWFDATLPANSTETITDYELSVVATHTSSNSHNVDFTETITNASSDILIITSMQVGLFTYAGEQIDNHGDGLIEFVDNEIEIAKDGTYTPESHEYISITDVNYYTASTLQLKIIVTGHRSGDTENVIHTYTFDINYTTN